MNHLLIAYTITAVCMDLKQQKVDNLWILFGWIAGIGYRFYQLQLRGIPLFFVGSVVPIAVLYWLFYFRMIGAGDIKLLSVIGGFIGPDLVIMCIGWSFVFGAMLSVLILALCDNLIERILYFIDYWKTLLRTKKIVSYRKAGTRMEHIHFTVPIFMSVLLIVSVYK